MFHFLKTSFGMAAVAACAQFAVAADLPPEIQRKVSESCRPDYHRICHDVVPIEGRAGRCLLDHEEQLSPSCLKAVKLAYAVEVCQSDYHRYCEGTAPGAQVVECLARRLGSLAPACERVVAANEPYVRDKGQRFSDANFDGVRTGTDRPFDRVRPDEDRPYARDLHADREGDRDGRYPGRYDDRRYDGEEREMYRTQPGADLRDDSYDREDEEYRPVK